MANATQRGQHGSGAGAIILSVLIGLLLGGAGAASFFYLHPRTEIHETTVTKEVAEPKATDSKNMRDVIASVLFLLLLAGLYARRQRRNGVHARQ